MKLKSLPKGGQTSPRVTDLCEADVSETDESSGADTDADDAAFDTLSEVSGQYDDIELFGLPWSGQRLNASSENSTDVDGNPTQVTSTSPSDAPPTEDEQVRIYHLSIEEHTSEHEEEKATDESLSEVTEPIHLACAFPAPRVQTANQNTEKHVE
jgi:hypothetical protein